MTEEICECGWHKCYHGEKDIIFSDYKGSPKERPCEKFKPKNHSPQTLHLEGASALSEGTSNSKEKKLR